MKVYKDIKQGTPEWNALRIGRVTGTRMKDLLAANNLPLVDKLIAERVSERTKEFYKSEEMERGNDMEPIAIQAYEEYTGLKVEKVGFLVSNKFDWFGVSPDGLISDNGVYKKAIEVKCPDTHNHVKYIRQGSVPSEYWSQILSGFIVNESLEEMDFISYDNRFHYQPLFIVTTKRVDIAEEISETEKAMVKFWDKFEKYYDQITF